MRLLALVLLLAGLATLPLAAAIVLNEGGILLVASVLSLTAGLVALLLTYVDRDVKGHLVVVGARGLGKVLLVLLLLALAWCGALLYLALVP